MSNGLQNGGYIPTYDEVLRAKTENYPFQDMSSVVDISPGKRQITYTWQNINASTPTGGDKSSSNQQKQILKNVTGIVRPGELLGVMGASGAGKSTLLNALTFRNNENLKLSGHRILNGIPTGRNKITAVSAYVQQDDLFITSLTVREHMIFQALLRMDKEIPYKARMLRVEELLVEFGLLKCADVVIGNPGVSKGVSGGERKRLAFASELLTDPPLMFCDEPTSGLDSYTSLNVVSALKDLTAKGKTIIITIHQPSSQVFNHFDRLLLMAEGRVAYLGDTQNALSFFRRCGYPCPTNYNPSDFYIETLAIIPGNAVECRSRVTAICDAFESSEEGRNLDNIVSTAMSSTTDAKFIEQETMKMPKSNYKASWIAQFRAVLWRSWISNIKHPMFIQVRMIQTVVMSMIIGIIFFGQEFNQDGVQNINGSMFMVMWYLTFANSFGTIGVFCMEFPMFIREHFNGMYRSDVYFVAKMIAELPFYIFFPSALIAIIYFMIGLQPDVAKFFLTIAIFVLVSNCAVSLGYLVSCFTSDVNVALATAPVVIVPLMLFGGLFLNAGSVPVWLVWFKYISWFYYGNEAVVITQWRDVEKIECNRENSTCPENGSVVLKSLGFQEDDIMLNMGILFVLVLAFRFAAYLVLLVRTYRR